MAQARNLLQDLLSTISGLRPRFASDKDDGSIEDLCTVLLRP